MSLSPLQSAEDRATEITQQESLQPSKTYRLNFDTGELEDTLIDEIEAAKQFIRKTIATPRFRHMIYSFNYGSEIDELIGEDLPMPILEQEVMRMISEALEYDERITDVNDFDISRSGDQLYVEFTVTLANGVVFTEEVTI